MEEPGCKTQVCKPIECGLAGVLDSEFGRVGWSPWVVFIGAFICSPSEAEMVKVTHDLHSTKSKGTSLFSSGCSSYIWRCHLSLAPCSPAFSLHWLLLHSVLFCQLLLCSSLNIECPWLNLWTTHLFPFLLRWPLQIPWLISSQTGRWYPCLEIQVYPWLFLPSSA